MVIDETCFIKENCVVTATWARGPNSPNAPFNGPFPAQSWSIPKPTPPQKQVPAINFTGSPIPLSNLIALLCVLLFPVPSENTLWNNNNNKTLQQ